MTNEALEPPYFEVMTPLNVRIRTTYAYWQKIITIKHPIMKGCERDVQQALHQPQEIRLSKTDTTVYLYYRSTPPYLTCVVTKHLNGNGFIITAYRTNRMKIGETIWTP